MQELIGFVIGLFYLRLCAYSGSKRLMGAFNGILYGILFSFFGILFILSFKRLDDREADI